MSRAAHVTRLLVKVALKGVVLASFFFAFFPHFSLFFIFLALVKLTMFVGW